MAFIYYPPETIAGASGIDEAELRHKYYARLAPDGKHLVPGMLQQGVRAPAGNWLKMGKVTRELPGRYFVQYTDFNTLVPGSLVQAERRPRGKWKEVVKGTKSNFHRVYYPDPFFTFNATSPPNSYGIYEDYSYVTWDFPDIFAHVYPGVSRIYYYKLYYFRGSFDELDNEASKLTLFNSAGAMLKLEDYSNVIDGDILNTNMGDASIYIEMSTNAAAGNYCFVLGILNEDNEVVDYVVMENVIERNIV